MTDRDYILAVLQAAGEVPGRTMLQKLVYLLSRLDGHELGYAPHFYGPYSASVQRTANDLRDLRLVNETVTVLPAWAPEQFDVHQYHYRLTHEGEQAAGELDASLRGRAERLVAATRDAHAWAQGPLAAAAKLDHLRRIDPGLDLSNVPSVASSFGWRLGGGDARHAASLLEHLGLLAL